MHLEEQVRDAIISELTRQGEEGDHPLKIGADGDRLLKVEGSIDVDELVMAVVGSVAGGP